MKFSSIILIRNIKNIIIIMFFEWVCWEVQSGKNNWSDIKRTKLQGKYKEHQNNSKTGKRNENQNIYIYIEMSYIYICTLRDKIVQKKS